jgi:hypothetical protein
MIQVSEEKLKQVCRYLDRTTRYHSSDEHILRIHSTTEYLEEAVDNKPWARSRVEGDIVTQLQPFWYAFGSEWLRFVYQWKGKLPRYTYEITVAKKRMAVLDAPTDAYNFTHRFAVQRPGGFAGRFFEKSHFLDWRAIGKEFAGVEISSLVASRCHSDPETDWINMWDVGSGVVWDATAVTGLRLVKDLTR